MKWDTIRKKDKKKNKRKIYKSDQEEERKKERKKEEEEEEVFKNWLNRSTTSGPRKTTTTDLSTLWARGLLAEKEAGKGGQGEGSEEEEEEEHGRGTICRRQLMGTVPCEGHALCLTNDAH